MNATLLQIAVSLGLGAAPADALLIPKGFQDASAFRYDTEVLGWSQDYKEIAVVAMTEIRGPRGKHRGDVAMVVFEVGKTVPIHNVNTHIITYAENPTNPPPMNTAKDFAWSVEQHAWQQMWPQKPLKRPPATHMRIKADTLLFHGSAIGPDTRGNVDTHTRKAQADALQQQAQMQSDTIDAAGSCVPWVGFVLTQQKRRRLQPHVPLDLSASCKDLHISGAKTVWAKATVASFLPRFDFGTPENEQSARPVVSASWALSRDVTFVVHARAPWPRIKRQRGYKDLLALGRVVAAKPSDRTVGPSVSAQGAETLSVVRSHVMWRGWAKRAAMLLGGDDVSWQMDDTLGDSIHLMFAPKKAKASQTNAVGDLAAPHASPANAHESYDDTSEQRPTNTSRSHKNEGGKKAPDALPEKAHSFLDDWSVP